MKKEIFYFMLMTVFAFLAFILFSQQGKAYYPNTWFYEHKILLGIITCVLTLASLYGVWKNTGHGKSGGTNL